MLTKFKQLLRSSKPVVLVTACVAILGMTGTAYSARLITGLDVRDGSLTAADLSKSARTTLHGGKGDKGMKGLKGTVGVQGTSGVAGQTGAQGPAGLQGPTGFTGPTGLQGPTGFTGAVSTVPGPQGPPGPSGAEGAICTVPGGHSGTVHWIDESGGAGTAFGLHCVGVA